MKVPQIALLVDTATGWGRRIVQGVLNYTAQVGPMDVWIEPKGQMEKFTVPRPGEADGIIARVSDEQFARALNGLGVPVVNVSGLIVKGAEFPRITTDWVAVARLAESHFRDRGLRNFAYVGPVHLSYVSEHEQAFEQVLAASATPCHVYQPYSGSPASRSAMQDDMIRWLRDLPKPIGIFTWGFQIGRDVISACRTADIPVPHDVAVLGGDYDALLCNACHPALSGIVTPARQIGYQAAAMLHAMMQGRKPRQKTRFLEPEEVEAKLSTETLAIDDPQIQQALIYLQNHACGDIRVEDILKEVPMGRRVLERKFTKLIGRSPAEEIRRIRINHARDLLVKTDLSVEQIAEACGFASYNYLGAVFKKETGISPVKYRNRFRRGAPRQE